MADKTRDLDRAEDKLAEAIIELKTERLKNTPFALSGTNPPTSGKTLSFVMYEDTRIAVPEDWVGSPHALTECDQQYSPLFIDDAGTNSFAHNHGTTCVSLAASISFFLDKTYHKSYKKPEASLYSDHATNNFECIDEIIKVHAKGDILRTKIKKLDKPFGERTLMGVRWRYDVKDHKYLHRQLISRHSILTKPEFLNGLSKITEDIRAENPHIVGGKLDSFLNDVLHLVDKAVHEDPGNRDASLDILKSELTIDDNTGRSKFDLRGVYREDASDKVRTFYWKTVPMVQSGEAKGNGEQITHGSRDYSSHLINRKDYVEAQWKLIQQHCAQALWEAKLQEMNQDIEQKVDKHFRSAEETWSIEECVGQYVQELEPIYKHHFSQKCLEGHTLGEYITRTDSHTCDVCNRAVTLGTEIQRCNVCNYDVCCAGLGTRVEALIRRAIHSKQRADVAKVAKLLDKDLSHLRKVAIQQGQCAVGVRRIPPERRDTAIQNITRLTRGIDDATRYELPMWEQVQNGIQIAYTESMMSRVACQVVRQLLKKGVVRIAARDDVKAEDQAWKFEGVECIPIVNHDPGFHKSLKKTHNVNGQYYIVIRTPATKKRKTEQICPPLIFLELAARPKTADWEWSVYHRRSFRDMLTHATERHRDMLEECIHNFHRNLSMQTV